MSTTELLMSALVLLMGIIGWFLRNKDAQQAEEIKSLKTTCKTLWEKHDEDVKALAELRVQIADGHYKKQELDVKFDKIESTFKTGFQEIGVKLDSMSKALLDHLIKEDKG